MEEAGPLDRMWDRGRTSRGRVRRWRSKWWHIGQCAIASGAAFTRWSDAVIGGAVALVAATVVPAALLRAAGQVMREGAVAAAEAVLAQLRSVVVDLLMVSGLGQLESTDALPPPPR